MSAIPDIAFYLVLMFSAALATIVARHARRAVRDYLGFAAALYAALSLAGLGAAAGWTAADFPLAVALVTGALAPLGLTVAIAAAFGARPRAAIAAPLLIAAAAAGICAAATGLLFVALAPLFACLCAMLALAARRVRASRTDALHALLAALCLLAAAAAFRRGADNAFALFCAAGLMATALAASGARTVRRAGAGSGAGSGAGIEQQRQRPAAPRAIGRLRLRSR
ncbi:MAG TPA: hypothetical protein VMH86_08205 [Rhizomicrobium sp.]|nr:hypothetical protein [Rhizomicrobium sp.]